MRNRNSILDITFLVLAYEKWQSDNSICMYFRWQKMKAVFLQTLISSIFIIQELKHTEGWRYIYTELIQN